MKTKLQISLIATIIMASQYSHAVDWVSLQGLEMVKKENAVKIWGFLEPEYAYTNGSELKAGPYVGQEAAFNQILPKNATNSTFKMCFAHVWVFAVNGITIRSITSS